jgi:uncharacterized protein with von Willebrand factor type A (vWA) domain
MDAMKKVQELEKAKSDGFFSSGDGSPNQLDNQQRRFDLVQRFQKDRTFKMVLELAGRIQKFGDDAVVETTDVPEAFVGFTAGNNFDGIQLEDLSMMNDQDLENLFWAEYCDETLLVDLFQGTKKRSKGNIVICSDVSGSMGTYLGRLDNGDVSRHHLCRAFVFAAMIKCRKEDRKCIDISFNSRVSRATEDPHIALDSSCGGGTNFNYPMRKAIDYIQKNQMEDSSDVIFITDGESHISTDYLEQLKATKARLWLYTIGRSHNYMLYEYAHRSFLLKNLERSMKDLSESIKDNS